MNRTRVWLAVLSAALVAVDQWTKAWAEHHVRGRGVLTLVPDLLDLRYARNRGAFFSLGEQLDAGLRRALFVLASLVVLGLIAASYRRAEATALRTRLGLGLLAAGALGNLIDRLRDGEVIDFIYLHAGAILHWATFNFADIWITLGLALLAVDWIRPPRGAVQREHAPVLGSARTDGGHS